MVKNSDPAPLIVTLTMDPASQDYFDEQRVRFFPPSINFLPAHISLFHHLPGGQVQQVDSQLKATTEEQAGFSVDVVALRNLGRGVAYALQSEPLMALRAHLRRMWMPWLRPQDQQPFRPHLTIQNKVDPRQARETLALLQESFPVQPIRATGIDLWSYQSGPWQHLRYYPFPHEP